MIRLCDFGEYTFQAVNDQVSTRLGMSDRRLRLALPLTSPFGCTLEEINIPGWLAGDARLDDFDEPPQQVDEGVRLRYGGRQFVYSRFGLEQYDEPTH